MNPLLPDLAVEFGESARHAFADLGGVDVARQAEADPTVRTTRVQKALDGLGVSDIDPRADLDSAAAAAELCRAAGRVVLPYPLVPVLLRADDRPLALVPGALPIDHGDLFPAWTAVTVDGDGVVVDGTGPALGTRLGPFVTYGHGMTPVTSPDATSPDATSPNVPSPDVALHLTLTAWQILGALEQAVQLAVDHVKGRIQFGQPIAAFQSVQFQLADAAIAVDGLREMCGFTLWRVITSPGGLADALAVRLAALDAARLVLRTTQQLHGAAGVCDEYDISVLCRHIQPLLRIPFGAEQTAIRMAAAVRREGFDSLFPHGALLFPEEAQAG